MGLLCDLVKLSLVKENGLKKTLIHCCMINSIHENITPSMLPPMISFLPLLLRAILRRPPCQGCNTFYPPVKTLLLSADAIRLPSLPPFNIKKHGPIRQHVTPVLSVFFYSMIFFSYSCCQGYYTMSCVSQLRCNKSFWSMKVLSWHALCWGKIFMQTLQDPTSTTKALPANHRKFYS